MAAAQVAALCAKLATPCNATTTQAWAGAPTTWASALLIDAARPMLAVLRPDGSVRAWDFADYAPTRSSRSTTERERLEIYPALYPAPGGHYAIAVVRNHMEGYSGGGAGFSYADFVVLNTESPNAAGATNEGKPYTLLYAGVPFSCSKMVRACFSEREYQTSRHCHDEVQGHLTIQFPTRASRATADAGWTFFWHETTWPAHVTKAHARRTQTRFTLPAGTPAPSEPALPRGVRFCGGPQ